MSSAEAGALKRKHSLATQQKLSFTAQQKPNSTAALSPSSKRSRLDSSPHPDAAPTPPATMSTADMYSFPSKRASLPAGADMVDLTSSPDASPAKPRKTMTPSMQAGGPKRLLVKNFRPTRKVDPRTFLDQTWTKIDAALDTIFSQADVDFSLEELYRGVENVCRQGMARDVRERLVIKCRDYVGGPLTAGVKESLTRGAVDVLRATLRAWSVWNGQLVRNTACLGWLIRY
jgi:cullin-4